MMICRSKHLFGLLPVIRTATPTASSTVFRTTRRRWRHHRRRRRWCRSGRPGRHGTARITQNSTTLAPPVHDLSAERQGRQLASRRRRFGAKIVLLLLLAAGATAQILGHLLVLGLVNVPVAFGTQAAIFAAIVVWCPVCGPIGRPCTIRRLVSIGAAGWAGPSLRRGGGSRQQGGLKF